MDAHTLRRAERVRNFNRFYTKQIGLLHEGLLESPFSLTEVRILYEIAHQKAPTAVGLASELALDAGYLSRILKSFEGKGLIRRTLSPTDGRQHHIQLTEAGIETFTPLDSRSTQDVAAMLERIAPAAQDRLLDALNTVEFLLSPDGRARAYLLRSHEPGDMGWVVQRHGAIYAKEYGWTMEFEGLVAGIVAAFLRDFDSSRERCWIAECDGMNLGCVFVVKDSDEVARLRLLLVEPQARGMGIGRRLVQECVNFARGVGYRKMTLWTQSNLLAARRLYADAGFQLVDQTSTQRFGADLISENWELHYLGDGK